MLCAGRRRCDARRLRRRPGEAGDRDADRGARPSGSCGLHGYRADWVTQAIEADIFLNLSEAEGFCIVVAEAMLAGLPVIAADVGGIRDYGRDGENMLKLSAPNAEGARAAILSLMRDPRLRERWAARRVRTCFGTTTFSHAGSRWRRRFHRHDRERSPRHHSNGSAGRHGLAGIPPGDLRRRRAADAAVGAGAARRGVAVTLLAPRLERRTPAREREGPVVVRRFRLRAAPNLGGRHLDAFLWWCLCISSWLWRNRRSYDLIYVVHGRLHAFPAVVAGKWLRKPVVVKPGRGGETHFDLSVVQRKRLLGSFFARRIARNTTAWVANSREIAADLSRWGVPRRAHPCHSQRDRRFRRMDGRGKQRRRSVSFHGPPGSREGSRPDDPRFRRAVGRYARSPDDPRRRAVPARAGSPEPPSWTGRGASSSRVRWPTSRRTCERRTSISPPRCPRACRTRSWKR